MADALYPAGRQAFLTGGIDWTPSTGSTISAALVGVSYTYSAAHTTWSDISGNVAAAVNVTTNVTQGDGIADISDVTWSSVTHGEDIESVVLYKRTGGTAAAPSGVTLIAYIDSASNLPLTPTGGDVTFQPADSGNYLFKL